MLLPLTGSLPQTCLSGVNLDKVLVRCFVLLSVTSCYHSYCIVWRVFVLVRNQIVTVLEGVVLELPPYSAVGLNLTIGPGVVSIAESGGSSYMMVNMVSFRLTVSTYYSSLQILSSYIVPNKTQENRRSPFYRHFRFSVLWCAPSHLLPVRSMGYLVGGSSLRK